MNHTRGEKRDSFTKKSFIQRLDIFLILVAEILYSLILAINQFTCDPWQSFDPADKDAFLSRLITHDHNQIEVALKMSQLHE